MKTKTNQWVCIRRGEVVSIFENRREAVKYFKDLLSCSLQDFNKQDKTDEFDYPIEIPEMKFIPIKERESYLGLL